VISQSKLQDKRGEVLAAALKLFVDYGFHGTPTSKIAAEAGVANGTLFHYYKTKEDLIIDLYNEVKNELNGFITSKVTCNSSLEVKVKVMFFNTIYWALDHPEKFYYIHQFHLSPHFQKVSPETICKQSSCHMNVFQQGINEELLKPYPIEFLLTLVSSHLFGMYQYLTKNQFPEAMQKQVISDAYELLWKMIKK
jgi:AcrR family transcriptional regulator